MQKELYIENQLQIIPKLAVVTVVVIDDLLFRFWAQDEIQFLNKV